MSTIRDLINFYKDWLGFENYYNLLLSNSINYPTEYVQSSNFLKGLSKESDCLQNEIITKDGDSRKDVPVWFGDIESAKLRIIVFGLEPRDTNFKFNIECVDKNVFATPFGVDRWNKSSSVKRKPQNRYYRVFEQIINRDDTFIIFSDVVKDYKIHSKDNTDGINDKNARVNFDEKSKSADNIEKLKIEIDLIKPTYIITLGNESFNTVNGLFQDKVTIIKLRHPARGGESKAKNMLIDYINSAINE